ncbi:MAG: hypothetical protein DMG13_30465 [Acidobacteria bacterium]|nr:MAG: hypothetical protein DMG13_30465 [Acidobacteriota bacterium]
MFPFDLTPPQVAHFLIDCERTLQRAIGACSAAALARIGAGNLQMKQMKQTGPKAQQNRLNPWNPRATSPIKVGSAQQDRRTGEKRF